MKSAYAFDVKIMSQDGRALQPAAGKKVKVSFATEEVVNNSLSAVVYHIVGPKDNIKAQKLATTINREAKAAEAQTTGLSYYVVEFISKVSADENADPDKSAKTETTDDTDKTAKTETTEDTKTTGKTDPVPEDKNSKTETVTPAAKDTAKANTETPAVKKETKTDNKKSEVKKEKKSENKKAETAKKEKKDSKHQQHGDLDHNEPSCSRRNRRTPSFPQKTEIIISVLHDLWGSLSTGVDKLPQRSWLIRHKKIPRRFRRGILCGHNYVSFNQASSCSHSFGAKPLGRGDKVRCSLVKLNRESYP